jgi:hypothetical protein
MRVVAGKEHQMKREVRKDRIEGNTVILYDDNTIGPKTLKTVEIITPYGKKTKYLLRRTTEGRYMFNK